MSKCPDVIRGLVHGILPLYGSRGVPVFVGYNEDDGMICIGKHDNPQVPVLKIDFKGLIPHLEKHGFIIEPYVCRRSVHQELSTDPIIGNFSYGVDDDPKKFDPVITISEHDFQIMISCLNIPKFVLIIDLIRLLPFLTEKGGYRIYRK